jgi:CxxC motif-containing protein (DUF1111 family)
MREPAHSQYTPGRMFRRSLTRLALCVGAIALIYASASRAQPPEDNRLINQGRRLFTRVWSVADGLGPTLNARSCLGCHSTPDIGGSGTDERAFVLIAPAVRDPSGGHVFRRLRVERTGAVTEQQPPRNGVIRKAPALFGSGSIESIPPEEIGTGIGSGRFGWKARFRNIDEAVEAAFANELGLGSERYPDRSAPPSRHKGIELSQTQLRAVSTFIRTLQPLRSNVTGSEAKKGRVIFQNLGCETCHRRSFPALEARALSPYTDLLLHDMGPGLADGIEEGAAKGRDFKTPPLWGITQTGPPYLHDGRAKSLTDAIAAHGGEAEPATTLWRKLSSVDRALLLAFLQSL